MYKYSIDQKLGHTPLNNSPMEPLLEKFGQRVIYDSTSNLSSKVSAIIEGEEWNWPLTNTLELMEIRDHMGPFSSHLAHVIKWCGFLHPMRSSPLLILGLTFGTQVLMSHGIILFGSQVISHGTVPLCGLPFLSGINAR